MRGISKNYKVTNMLMGPDFRLTCISAQMLAQDCFASYMARHNVAAFDLARQSKMWIISEFYMRFSDPMPFWGDTVTVESWMSENPAVKVFIDYRLTHRGRVFSQGYAVWAILDIMSRRPVACAEILSPIECVPELTIGSHHHRISRGSDLVFSYSHVANNGNTDFNGHVSNITYLKMCSNAMPMDYLSTHRMTSVDVKFVRESFLGQELRCQVFAGAGPDSWTYVIQNGDGLVNCEAAASFVQGADGEVDYDNLEIRNA